MHYVAIQGEPVHPHVRGEHLGQCSARRALAGSSPRAWGTRIEHRLQLVAERFIPTCVGNTTVAMVLDSKVPVHPHVRGEHTLSTAQIKQVLGSSPRAWGTRLPRAGCRCRRRFIPTCVGNTSSSASRAILMSVHPHVRGEHGKSAGRMIQDYGSSPRAWGTRPTTTPRSCRRRFIPTCVGNTAIAGRTRQAMRVHPHVRGEHASVSTTWRPCSGSSPRAWGTPRWGRRRRH